MTHLIIVTKLRAKENVQSFVKYYYFKADKNISLTAAKFLLLTA